MRRDREDTSRQEANVAACRDVLADELEAAAVEARACEKDARRKLKRPGAVDLLRFHELVRRVARAEEALDLALLDLHTASGGDA